MSTSTALMQNNFDMPAPRLPTRKLAKTMEEPTVVTSNTTIFPSLHPLSNHYRQKAPTVENPKTIKKVRLENSEKTIEISSPDRDFDSLKTSKKITKGFEGKPWKGSKGKINKSEPLTVSDPVMAAIKNMQAQQMVTMQRQMALQRDMMIQQQISQRVLEYTLLLNSLNFDQEQLLFDSGAQNSHFNLDQSLRFDDDITSQLIPNLSHLMKICQKNQEKLSY